MQTCTRKPLTFPSLEEIDAEIALIEKRKAELRPLIRETKATLRDLEYEWNTVVGRMHVLSGWLHQIYKKAKDQHDTTAPISPTGDTNMQHGSLVVAPTAGAGEPRFSPEIRS